MRIKNKEWEVYKSREDKLFANSLPVADNLYAYVLDPITLDELCGLADHDQYFRFKDKDTYKHMRAYMNAVKTIVLQNTTANKHVLDLGVGRGQDLYKYALAGVNSVTGVDSDITALQECVQRKYDLLYQCSREHHKRLPDLSFIQCNLATRQVQTLAHMIDKGYIPAPDVITAMFSFHYYHDNLLIYDLIRQSKQLVLLAIIDKERILQLVGKNHHYKKGPYHYIVDPNTNQLSIKLPFSDQLMKEPLLDIQTISHHMNDAGFDLQESINFADPRYQNYKPTKHAALNCSPHDRANIQLYTLLVFQKRTHS
jgi:SAM-dependent methyltransferase